MKFDQELEIVRYNASRIVDRAIHLIRNPFDNVVARFHLAHKRAQKKGTGLQFTTQFPNDRAGFRAWCRDLDTRKSFVADERRQSHVLGEDVIRAFDGVPCHADFYRYAQWHNLAFETVAEMEGVSELTLRYESYGTDFDGTLATILKFLKREPLASERSEFVPGKNYGNFFTTKERRNAESLLQLACTNVTWSEVKEYFTSSSGGVAAK